MKFTSYTAYNLLSVGSPIGLASDSANRSSILPARQAFLYSVCEQLRAITSPTKMPGRKANVPDDCRTTGQPQNLVLRCLNKVDNSNDKDVSVPD